MRRRFVTNKKTGELEEVTSPHISKALNLVRTDCHFKMPDGTEITSRKKREEYMRRNNLVDFEYQEPRRYDPKKREKEIIAIARDQFEARRDLARARGERFFGRR